MAYTKQRLVQINQGLIVHFLLGDHLQHILNMLAEIKASRKHERTTSILNRKSLQVMKNSALGTPIDELGKRMCNTVNAI